MRDDVRRATPGAAPARPAPSRSLAAADAPPTAAPAAAGGPTPAQRQQYLDLIDQGKPEEAAAFLASIRGR